MRRLLALLLVFALVLLPGCRRRALPKPEYTLNPDGTVDSLRWGMTYAQAARTVKQIAQEHPDAWLGDEPEGTKATVFMPQGTILGYGTGYVHLIFRHFTAEGKRSPLRLAEIRVSFYPEAELEDLCFRAEEALTLMEPKSAWSWTSPETLGDRASREAIEKTYRGYTEESVQRKCDTPLYTVPVSYAEYRHKLLTANRYYAAFTVILEEGKNRSRPPDGGRDLRLQTK